jgi:acetyltransferase
MSLKYFFNPRAVAVIGASNNPEKLGRQILDNLIKGGFKGRIFPINLKEKKIAGLKAYPDLGVLPKREMTALLVVVAIPAPFVLEEIKKCGHLGIKNIIIITAGFRENGTDGKKLEEDIAMLAKKYHLNILGPNCLGLINTWHKLNATFASADRETGNSALLSQSGAIGAAALDWLKVKDFNFGYFISLGNKAVLDENKIMAYLGADKRIDLVVAYLEEIKNGPLFMEQVSRLVKRKPVAILKAGTSAAGGQLALSHTGSLAGSAAAVRVGVERAGAIWLENMEDLFNLLVLFRKESWHNRGEQKLYVITNAGGAAVLTVDEISRHNIPFGGSQDLLGDADAARYQIAINKLLADKKVNNLLVLLTPQTSTEPLKTAQAIVAASKKYPHKLIMVSFMGGQSVTAARNLFSKNNVPTFDYPEEAIRSFKKLIDYQIKVKSLRGFRALKMKTKPALGAVSLAKNMSAADSLPKAVDYLSAFAELKRYNIPVVKTVRYSPNGLASYKYPAVLKITGPDFSHKTDRGGVVVNLKTPTDLRAAAEKMAAINKIGLKNAQNYLVVQEQAAKFQEIILGFKHDAAFGPLMMIGQGGIYTEVFKDFKLAISDINKTEALKLIKELKIYPVLNGARGQKKYDLAALAQALVNLARLANEHPEISELDINPLFVFEKGIQAGDVRIIL